MIFGGTPDFYNELFICAKQCMGSRMKSATSNPEKGSYMDPLVLGSVSPPILDGFFFPKNWDRLQICFSSKKVFWGVRISSDLDFSWDNIVLNHENPSEFLSKIMKSNGNPLSKTRRNTPKNSQNFSTLVETCFRYPNMTRHITEDSPCPHIMIPLTPIRKIRSNSQRKQWGTPMLELWGGWSESWCEGMASHLWCI